MEDIEDDFYYRLQQHSVLYRILLARPYLNKIQFNQWNRIDLKLVNEFGLTLTEKQQSVCWLEIDCALLTNQSGRIEACQSCVVLCRPVQKDGWELTTQSDIAGFQYHAEGNFEYMVSLKDEGYHAPGHYFLQIIPTQQERQSIHAFPLVIGPLTIGQHVVSRWEDTALSVDIFHAYRVQEYSYLLVKEDWKQGTSGKLWDSAVVLSQIFCNQIHDDPLFFKHRRILDLSAGTGCVGLLLASLLKDIYEAHHYPLESLPRITMTDLPEALDLIYQNRECNHLEDYANVMPLAWGNYDHARHVLMDGPIDTIIASDVLYTPSSFKDLVDTLDWLTMDGGHVDIYLGYKRRGLSSEEELYFFDICSQKFEVKTLCSSLYSDKMTHYPVMTSKKETAILNEFSSMCVESGVNIYQLIRK
ncbi:Protein-lysine methyltransferase METTL21B [Choanephora cucurbitarum]|uniref:Protein-lysine methyltransferase METTL21B n=1 Tax=Choanephora cucurbitarum TaxID=101091 RepID=A0A1C7NET0_9FUNG|nr:Protein-lysine methyltransferase METTL21B [Choanephora cucurbitarum]